MSIYMYFSFPSMLSESKKEEYLNKFAYGYPAVKFIEKDYKDHTIITREENFYLLKNNYIPIFKYEIQKMNKNLFFNTSKLKNNNILIVVNLKSNKKLKDGSTGYYVNGLKLEQSNISIFTNKEEAWQLLTKIGQISIRSEKNEIYRVQVDPKYLGGLGVREKLYNELKMSPIGKKAQFRSYLYSQARKNSVFYEPIKLPRERVRLLLEEQGEIEEYSRTRKGMREG